MVARLLNFGKRDYETEQSIPVCNDHGTQMELYKKLGRAARYTDQETETYTLIFRCPHPGCDNTAERKRVRNQIPVPGESTVRPDWAQRRRKSL